MQLAARPRVVEIRLRQPGGKCSSKRGITAEDSELDVWGDLAHKEIIKRKLKPILWDLDDAAIAALAEKARTRRMAIEMLIVPRVGDEDSAGVRAETEARLVAIANRLDIPLLNLSATFDNLDPTHLKIAPADDHPNAVGQKMLFRALVRELGNDESLSNLLFDPPESVSPQS